jgi:hypothetical protein
MTVKELQEQLEKLPEDAQVKMVVKGQTRKAYALAEIVWRANENTVSFESGQGLEA